MATELIDSGKRNKSCEKDANTLSGAAATATALAMISRVDTGFLLLVAMSGTDIRLLRLLRDGAGRGDLYDPVLI